LCFSSLNDWVNLKIYTWQCKFSIYEQAPRARLSRAGREQTSQTTPHYEYTLSDHLGNGRVYYTDLNNDGIGTMADLLQDNRYYPFGLNHTDPRRNNGGVGVNLYQYNGKELVEDNGLSWHSYGKRYYDAVIGRFPNVDPLIDTFHFVTGYNYAENEPVANVDLWGLQKMDFKAMATFTKEKARDLGDYAGMVEGGALLTTIVSGGLSSEVTVPAAIAADVLSKISVGVEAISDAIDGNGIEKETIVHVVTETVSPIMSKQVSDHIVLPVVEKLAKSYDNAKASIKAAFEEMQNLIEKGTEEALKPENEKP
jgi:RHS repeat-associated protein